MSISKETCRFLGIAAIWFAVCCASSFAQPSFDVEPYLGKAPTAPTDVSGLPGRGPRTLDVTGVFSVDTTSREQARQFYNSVYSASANIPINSTANTSNCVPGTNSTAFQNAVLRRVNWFRAMSGMPAAVTLNSAEGAKDQTAAVIMAANTNLMHVGIPSTWRCFDVNGTNAAANSNLALGSDGPDAVTGYIWDYGTNNFEVGHRRWVLYPQTQVMGTGDDPAEGIYLSANALWVFDGNYGGPRPATTFPFVSWPPPGYVPYTVVFPRWSFGFRNADFSAATVTMLSGGNPIDVTLETITNGYGENTLVWYPSALDPKQYATLFPFNGSDTTYSVTLDDVNVAGVTTNFSYNVTLFDPNVRGPDYAATMVTGTNRPSANYGNPYTCSPSPNPNVTGYEWLSAKATNGNLVDTATNGLANFTISPSPPIYSIITNSPVSAGNCFHLTHTNRASNPVPQLLQFKQVFVPATNASLTFQSLLGYSGTGEIARVQASINNGANWTDLYAQAGNNTAGETSFTSHTLSLSNYAGQMTLLRFDYDVLAGGSYYPQSVNTVGWCLQRIVVTNAVQLVNLATNVTASTNFNFTPTQTGSNVLAACGVLFTQFPLEFGPVRLLTAVSTPPPTLVTLNPPFIAAGHAQLGFTIIQGTATVFKLLQAGQIAGPWTTNTGATLTTNTPGSSYQFAIPSPAVTTFYRIQAH